MGRRGSRVARVVLAVVTALATLVTLVLCVAEWALVVPLFALALQVGLLVLLFAPDTTAWFARR